MNTFWGHNILLDFPIKISMFSLSFISLSIFTMAVTTKFQGKFMYYENINGKEKKVSKEFTDQKKFNEFTKKYPMPTISSIFGLSAPAKVSLPAKKSTKKTKKPTKKK